MSFTLTGLVALKVEHLFAERARLLAEYWKRASLKTEGALGDVELALLLKAESQKGRIAERPDPPRDAAPAPPRFWGAPPEGKLGAVAAGLGFAGVQELVDAMRQQEKGWRRGPELEQARRRRVAIIAAVLAGRRFRRVSRGSA